VTRHGVLLVDDEPLARQRIRQLLHGDPDFDVVGECADAREIAAVVRELRPDVVFLDVRMPHVDGTVATARIRASRPGVKVVVLTTFDDDDHLFPALAAGACGFLVKDATPDELLAAVRAAAAGETPYSPAVLRRLVDQAVRARLGEAPPPALPDTLTGRERDVLALVGAGLSNREIADRLHLGVTTVKTHVTSLLAKTGSANRIRLALLAAQSGLADPT